MILPLPTQNWRHVDREDLGVTNGLSLRIGSMEALGEIQLPNLRRGYPLRIASDYAGQDVRLHYRVLSFLIVDRLSLLKWDLARRTIRDRFLSSGETISFKSLRGASKTQAIIPFLETADGMNGVVAVIAVSKTI